MEIGEDRLKFVLEQSNAGERQWLRCACVSHRGGCESSFNETSGEMSETSLNQCPR